LYLFEERDCAEVLGINFSAAIASLTLQSVLLETEPFPEITLETVPIPTPANFATSLIVAILLVFYQSY
jgi:hypothetical protein